ncbi:MAG: alpha-ketoglutarate-dependent dioxygenase AlkB [Rhodospirillaceae bacterium]|nr:alpha-ketoglutarate-dependent dioxygenase AlkB [Rhodospirillaceae bacterium]
MTTQEKLLLGDPQNARLECATVRDSPSQNQIASTGRESPSWLGLVTSHRRLFDASQDGWLRPLSRSCFLLGYESFVSEEFPAGRNFVAVRLVFDVDKLPFRDARKDLDRCAAGSSNGEEPRVVHWRAPIPLYAVKKVEVPSTEQKTHLLAMAGQFSNVSLSNTDVAVNDFVVQSPAAGDPSTPETQWLELPETLNAIQGAMAMAVWAVPRVEPWIEVLRHALGSDLAAVTDATRKLGANWLKPPWLAHDLSATARDDEDDRDRLWRAALRCMRWSNAEDKSPGAVAEKIAGAASLDVTNRTAETWLDRTRRIVAAEETITCDNWRQNGAGLAIWLALLRPEPMRFKSWSTDLPGLPPAVWWAAAMLCGWRHGYRILDKKFRGDANLQEFLATRALEASWPGSGSAVLPPSQRSAIVRTPEDGWFTLSWCGHPVIRKPWRSRAKWYIIDLSDDAAASAARKLAGQLGWPCFKRWLTLPDGRVPTFGSGSLLVDGDDLVVEGAKTLQLPTAANVEERFDPDEFRHQLATEAGVVSDPPEASLDQRAGGVPGLIYRPGFITEEDEAKLVALIDGAEWSTELRRRVQHYGWRYDYTQRQIDESMRVGELPAWARELAQRLVDEGWMKDLPDQVIVNEYCGKQGISRHIDQPRVFAERVATISLLETWGMVFRRRNSKRKVEIPLERRSIAVLTGDARYKWTHEIPNRKTELLMGQHGKRRRVVRSRRISLTFRKTRKRRNA